MDYDRVRRKYLAALHRQTSPNPESRRNIVLYASGWLQKPEARPTSVAINDEDMQGFMEVTHGLEGGDLDLILHSPGGSIEAAEAIVLYLRSRFSHIRIIVPQLAMSVAAMIACAADEVVLGKHSFLGPTDPQFILQTPLGMRMVPAQAILDQFHWARDDCLDPARQSVWRPMLTHYGPDLLQQSESVLKMSKTLVKTWLQEYMLKEKVDDEQKKAEEISDWLSGHKNFMSHSRHISRAEAERRGLVVSRLENDPDIQDLALSVFHATTHTFSSTPATKIIESHTGRAFIKVDAVQPTPTG